MLLQLSSLLALCLAAAAAPQNVQWFEIEQAEPVRHLKIKANTNFEPYEDVWKEFKTLYG